MRKLALLCIAASMTVAVAGVPGTYSIDKQALKEAMNGMLDQQLAMLPEDQRATQKAAAEQMMMKQVENIKMVLTFHADGSVDYEGDSGMGEAETGKGTWKLEGDQLTMVKTEKNGEKTEEESVTATFKGDKIVIQPEGAPFGMVLVKQ